MMTIQRISLDTLAADAVLDQRLEMSLPLAVVARQLGLPVEPFMRDGLGPWLGIGLTGSLGPVLIAAPQDDPEAGCSVWFASGGPAVTEVAAALAAMLPGHLVAFMSPDGEPILPVSRLRPGRAAQRR